MLHLVSRNYQFFEIMEVKGSQLCWSRPEELSLDDNDEPEPEKNPRSSFYGGKIGFLFFIEDFINEVLCVKDSRI